MSNRYLSKLVSSEQGSGENPSQQILSESVMNHSDPFSPIIDHYEPESSLSSNGSNVRKEFITRPIIDQLVLKTLGVIRLLVDKYVQVWIKLAVR